MGDSDDLDEIDITDPILEEHRDVYSRFVALWNKRASGDPGEPSLDAAWRTLAHKLKEHANAEDEARR